MIKKNIKYGKTENVIIAEFGTGQIRMVQGSMKCKSHVDLTFTSMEEPQPINVTFKHDFKSFDELKPEIVFRFTKPESIDSLISMLEDCRKDFK